ncbi:hypothetical protein IZ6_25190 [Terrihabitans soli]|uniref:Uncharacterized protein n=1 Tax=Terrihabitans soli TaxID=708113 RepID=A0A6S6QMS2_9HYPH|nr:hypothetical protein [Terrihabitans soli]BCJ91784.1 hypothetical protein IZ6_25190 [Terrihabitans soli]
MDFLAGLSIAVPVFFTVSGDPKVPDSGTAVYTVYDQAGEPITGLIDVPLSTGPTTTRTIISISQTYTSISSGRFSKLTVIVRFVHGGMPHTLRIPVRLVPFINYSASPADVRSYCGVNASELPDGDIDIFEAFLTIESIVGQTELAAALAAGTKVEVSANMAILYAAALSVLPSLQLRVAQRQSDGPLTFDRAPIKDFSKLYGETQSLLTEALNLVTGRSEGDNPLLVLTTPVDPITGA